MGGKRGTERCRPVALVALVAVALLTACAGGDGQVGSGFASAVEPPTLAPATPHGDHLVALARAGHPVGCADVTWAAATGLVTPAEVVEVASLGVACPHPQYPLMLALAAQGALTCADVEWNAGAGFLGAEEAAELAGRLPGCRLSTHAALTTLVERGLRCEDVAWHLERALLTPDQAASLRAALAARGTHCAAPEAHTFGTSVEGRALVAWRRAGGPSPTRTAVVVGLVHGEEPGGRAVAERLLQVPLPADLELWVVPSLNPDGEAVGQRGNAHGVDLNRNFPTGWLPPGSHPYTSGGYHSGPAPASEPEVQAAMALVRATGPDVTLWYHQPWGEVICDLAAAGATCTDFAARVGLPAGPADRPGSAIGWQAAEGLGAALVVELPDGPPPPATVDAHVAAVLAAS